MDYYGNASLSRLTKARKCVCRHRGWWAGVQGRPMGCRTPCPSSLLGARTAWHTAHGVCGVIRQWWGDELCLVLFQGILSQKSLDIPAHQHSSLQHVLGSCSPARHQRQRVGNFQIKPCFHRNTQIRHGLVWVLLVLFSSFFSRGKLIEEKLSVQRQMTPQSRLTNITLGRRNSRWGWICSGHANLLFFV